MERMLWIANLSAVSVRGLSPTRFEILLFSLSSEIGSRTKCVHFIMQKSGTELADSRAELLS